MEIKKNDFVMCFVVRKGRCRSNDDVRVARDTVFRKDMAGSWFRIRRFRQRKLGGGATVER